MRREETKFNRGSRHTIPMKTQQRKHSPFAPWLGVTLLLAALLMNAQSQSQPVTLTLKGRYANLHAEDVQVVGRYAYVAAWDVRDVHPGYDVGLVVIDVSDPTRPRRVGSYGTSAGAVRVVGDYAYVLGSRDGFLTVDLLVIDVRDPTQPREVGFHEISVWLGAEDVLGNYA